MNDAADIASPSTGRATSRRAALLTAAAAWATAVVPLRTGAQTLMPLHVGLIPSDFAAQAVYALDLGFFRKAGFEATLTGLPSGPAIASAVASGAFDTGYSNIVSLAIAHDRGFPFQILAGANMYTSRAASVGLIGVKASGPIEDAKDFTGKTIAVGALNNITEIGARVWLDATGGDSSKVKFVEIPISAMAPAVLSGRVAGAVMDPGVYPTLGKPGDPIRVIAHAFDSIAPEFLSGAWFSTAAWIEKHPAEAKRFADVMNEAAHWGNSHHRKSAPLVARYLKESVSEIAGSTRVLYGTTLSQRLMQPSIAATAKYGIIKKNFPALELVSQLVESR